MDVLGNMYSISRLNKIAALFKPDAIFFGMKIINKDHEIYQTNDLEDSLFKEYTSVTSRFICS